MADDKILGVRKGVTMYFNEEDGFWGKSGPQHFGFCDTYAELREEIDLFLGDPSECDFPLDTPSLDDTLHLIEMDIG